MLSSDELHASRLRMCILALFYGAGTLTILISDESALSHLIGFWAVIVYGLAVIFAGLSIASEISNKRPMIAMCDVILSSLITAQCLGLLSLRSVAFYGFATILFGIGVAFAVRAYEMTKA